MTVCILDDYVYWLWLSLTGGCANAGYSLLLEHFKDAKEIYDADLGEYSKIDGLDKRFASKLMNKDLSSARDIFDFCNSHSVRLLHCMESDYPIKLKWTYAYPVLLYVYGTLPNLNEVLTVGVVGTRNYTEYGKIAAYRIGGGLARAKSVVISGMALGNDSIAQLAAINNGGKTVAVMGTGIDRIYPSEHRELAKLIAKNGAIVTEFAPGTPPRGMNFPIRNRIISGLSDAVALIEAPERSGALITVKYAVEQDRNVYAVPGDITSKTSAGPISLLKDGAKPITNASDIIEDYVCQYSYLNSVMENTDFNVSVPRTLDTVPEPARTSHRVSDSALFFGEGKKTSSRKIGTSKSAKRKETKDEKVQEQSEGNRVENNRPLDDGSRETALPKGLGEVEEKIYLKIAEAGRINAEMLADGQLSSSEILSALTKLEIIGAVSSQAGGFYCLSDRG